VWLVEGLAVSNFKRMVHERMAKTGESYSTAARHIRARKLPKPGPEAYPIEIQVIIPDRPPPDSYLPSCGACGRVLRPDDEHDGQACWDKVPCRSCGEVHGYLWDHGKNKKICKGCGHERDIV